MSAGLIVSSSLWILNEDLDCSQTGLTHCKINNCSNKRDVVLHAPSGPECTEQVGVAINRHGTFPVLKVVWKLRSDGILSLRGSQINILEKHTNLSLCVQFSYTFSQQLNPNHERWTFSLDGVVVEPGQTYVVSVVNLPEPMSGDNVMRREITIPGCGDSRIQKAQICLENGSLWEPYVATNMSFDQEHKKLFITVSFQAAQYSERYRVSIQNQAFNFSKDVSNKNGTSLSVTCGLGLWQLPPCEMLLSIQPFFKRCKNDCQSHKEKINYCLYYQPRTLIIKGVVALLVSMPCLIFLLWRASHTDSATSSSPAATDQPERVLIYERKRVLILYSLDHPLYKTVVLRFCSFLMSKCGTEVVLDLLDSDRLGALGSIQWLSWRSEQIESSSDKILILCSPGVQAKWKAMCGGKRVFLREDVQSPVGDMLTPALSLLVPHFVRSASFKKYIVAYFDSISSEEDVPLPFNITVRYKLMTQFEELFFRILDLEKREPGRVNHIEGLSENQFHQCPSGQALQDAVEAFRAYQLEHPQWFEEELMEAAELEMKETYQ